jgi:serine/threonine protein kinase
MLTLKNRILISFNDFPAVIFLNRNFIFELCQANLEEFITKKYNGVMPDEIEGLYQMASGLKFIHEKNMIHRDIKPENVLISLTGQRACLKITDLGLTKPLNEDGTHFDLASGLKGTEYYMAPELLVLRNLNRRDLDEKCTTASDVFAAGCTFFRYCADGGLHPFGHGFNIEGNIMTGNSVNVTGM